MANVEEIVIKVNTSESKTSVKELRNEMKGLKDELVNLEEGTEEYNQALKRAAEIQQQFKDTSENIRQSSGDLGVAFHNTTNVISGMIQSAGALTAGMQLLGIENEGVVEGIAKLQQISALATGVKGFDGMTKSIGFLGKNLSGLVGSTKLASAATSIWNAILYANPVVLIVVGVAALVAGIAALVYIMSSNNEKQKVANGLLDDYNKLLVANKDQSDLKLRLMEAEGASNRNLIKEKMDILKIEDDLNKVEIRRLESIRNRTKNENTALEQRKLDRIQNMEDMKKLEDDLIVEERKIISTSNARRKKEDDDAANDKIKANKDKNDKIKADNKAAREKDLELITKTNEDIRIASLSELSRLEEDYNKKVELFKKYNESTILIDEEYRSRKLEIEDEERERQKEKDEEFKNYLLGIEQDKYDQIQLITDQGYLNRNLTEWEYQEESLNNNIVNLQSILSNEQIVGAERLNFENQLIAAKMALGDLEVERKKAQVAAIGSVISSASKLFGEHTKVGKILAIADATISTYQSAQAAYSSLIGVPIVGPILAPIGAGLAVAAGLKNIKEIMKVKIPTATGGGDSGGGGVSAPSVSAPQAPSLPKIPNNIQGSRQILTNDEVNLQNQPVKAYVVESEISTVQKRVNQTQNESSF